jgi:pimeloyl-ACP methyl ester carboxylesterase
VADLAAVVRAVSDGPAALVGCSSGSLVTLHCALEHPELVAKLVLVGPIVSGLPFSEHFATRGGRGVPGPDTSRVWCCSATSAPAQTRRACGSGPGGSRSTARASVTTT